MQLAPGGASCLGAPGQAHAIFLLSRQPPVSITNSPFFHLQDLQKSRSLMKSDPIRVDAGIMAIMGAHLIYNKIMQTSLLCRNNYCPSNASQCRAPPPPPPPCLGPRKGRGGDCIVRAFYIKSPPTQGSKSDYRLLCAYQRACDREALFSCVRVFRPHHSCLASFS